MPSLAAAPKHLRAMEKSNALRLSAAKNRSVLHRMQNHQ
jgi:hypothetical protein